MIAVAIIFTTLVSTAAGGLAGWLYFIATSDLDDIIGPLLYPIAGGAVLGFLGLVVSSVAFT